MSVTLILGSAPMAVAARAWPRAPFDRVLAINNAHAIRDDWNELIFPHDFPADRVPALRPGQRLVTESEFVPAQNSFGGFVYAGGTMAFTAGYYALHAHQSRVIAFYGCDMVYPAAGQTHFYGTGTADPLRTDITLRSLEAKSARLLVMAAMQGVALVNLSTGPSRLIFPRARQATAARVRPAPFCALRAAEALKAEAALGYLVPSGRYWEEAARFDPAELDLIDALWRAAATEAWRQTA
jgi:hypothetical protein